MKILAIETSCDETAIALLSCEGDAESARFKILGNALLSQIDLHKEYGGVFPALAKREHAKNLVPVLSATLEEAGQPHEAHTLSEETIHELRELLSREVGLADALLEYLSSTGRPAIDVIAITHGPGLEPALWVGVNFAKALSRAWSIPLIPVNHMEGHLLSALAQKNTDEIRIEGVALPVLALLISGGHTELVLMKDWLSYSLMGQTRDDAVGEAFDKVARMMDLPYPGGPEVSKLAEKAREREGKSAFVLPRPMLDSADFDFSFSGLKTAVLYLIKGKEGLTEEDKEMLSMAFEDAVAEVLVKKTMRASEESGAYTVVMGGGVSANTHIQRVFRKAFEGSSVTLRIPSPEFTTDNAVMIGIAGYYQALSGKKVAADMKAQGNLSLA